MAAKAKLAFVGLGTMGKDLLGQAVKNPKAEIVGLCDLEAEALGQAAAIAGAGPKTFTDYHAMFGEIEADGVVVAVPQDGHARISIDSLNAGFATFCEKPMALSVNQCEAMIAAARKNSKALMIGQVLRYINVYRYVIERVRSGELGRPFGVRIIRTMGAKWGTWARPWRLKKETSGGMLLEMNVHEIDLMRCILGEARSVSALGQHFMNPEVDYEDLITAQIAFVGGGIGSLTTAACDHLGRYTGEVYCEKGSVYFDSVSRMVHVGKDGQEKEEIAYADVHPEWENGVYREVREFVEACLGEHPVTIPGEEGMRNVEIGEACYVSILEGWPVALPLPRS